MFVESRCEKAGHNAQRPGNAPSIRLKSDSPNVELRPLESGAGAVLWAHQNDFEVGEHWYEYLIGATAEGASIWGILVPEDYYHVYAGFVELFKWEEGCALESLYIFSKYRNQGIGSQVVKTLEKMSYDRLTIWAGRASAPFYERLGYSRDTTQGGFMLTKGPYAGKTYTQAASQYWRNDGQPS